MGALLDNIGEDCTRVSAVWGDGQHLLLLRERVVVASRIGVTRLIFDGFSSRAAGFFSNSSVVKTVSCVVESWQYLWHQKVGCSGRPNLLADGFRPAGRSRLIQFADPLAIAGSRSAELDSTNLVQADLYRPWNGLELKKMVRTHF